ncbi:13886_t:CDS:2 [Cetraspora pellucida]|uniref:13886_t:CDS:1 n=1 Tax=Cetraspora pellucida TaxID=1433469 RepID=A0A9N9IHC2_9GLOM|nr:13886_t:CDS:2 [Cetraspora pellucida]
MASEIYRLSQSNNVRNSRPYYQGHTVKLKQEKTVNHENNLNNYVDNGTETSNIHTKSIQTRDTNCPATLKIQLLKRDDSYPYIVHLLFNHNYPFKSSYVTSFHPVSEETKKAIFKLFDIGYSPNSMYHTYWKEMQLKYENNEEMLADRMLFPHKNNIKYLYKKYHNKHMGAQNRSQNNSKQPFILVIIMNLMKCCHKLQKSEELVYIDTTARLDVLNTPLTILSTSTSADGLPHAAILTSNETAETFTKALSIVKHMVPSIAFGR